MKDFIKSKIDEARESGRDVPAVMEEMFMHFAAKMDGEDVDAEHEKAVHEDPEPDPAH